MKKLFSIVKEKSDRLTESYRLKADAFDLSTLTALESGSICTSDILRGTKPAFLQALEHQGDDIDLFLRIVRYLENGPFPEMTLRERIRLLDTLIDKFKKNSELAEKLKVYRDTMTGRQSLLDEVFDKLRSIEEEEKERSISVQRQLAYLQQCLLDETYSPVWRTLQTLYENTAAGSHQNTCLTVGDLPAGDQVYLLNRLKETDSSAELHETIENLLDSEKLSDAAERFVREKSKNPDSLEEIIRQVTKEDLDFDTWASRFESSAGGETPEGKEPEAPSDPGELKNELKAMLSGHDWSEAKTSESFSRLVSALIDREQEKALPFLVKILSHDKVAEETRESLQKALVESDTSLFTDLHNAIKLIEASDDSTEIFNLLRKKYSSHLPDSVTGDLKKFFAIQENARQGAAGAFKVLQKEEDLSSALKFIAAQEEAPAALKKSAQKIHEELTTGNIDQAIRSITILTSPPSLKIELLERLKAMTIAHDVSEEDPVIQKIERKISFYRQIADRSEKSRKHVLERQQQIHENLAAAKKQVHIEHEENKEEAPAPGKEKAKEEKEEAPLLASTLHIVKNFSDNIDSLEPALEIMKGLISEKDGQRIEGEIHRIKGDDKRFLSGTLDMIEQKKINIDLLAEIQKVSPRAQYRWSQALREKTGVKKFEEAFNPLLEGKKLPDEINRLVRVIYSNNQNNFLKDSLDREKKLVEKIAADFTNEGLTTLRKKTRNSQDRDKINLFRDFIKAAGESPAPQTLPRQEMLQTSPNEKKAPPPHGDDDKQVATPSKKQKDETVEKIQAYLSSEKSKSEMVRQSSKAYINDINQLFDKIAAGDQQALGIINRHRGEFTELFSYILRNKKQDTFPEAARVASHCLKAGIIRREEL